VLSLDIMDISGEHQDDVHAEVSRNRIDAMGKRIDGKQSAGESRAGGGGGGAVVAAVRMRSGGRRRLSRERENATGVGIRLFKPCPGHLPLLAHGA
jgi:hypothetical protein